jgi:diguanylate cyclase (GGDEF)-like protein
MPVLRYVLRWAVLIWAATWAMAAANPTGGQYLFRTYGPDQGLVFPSFSCMAQDDRGFLWIGTESGLARYDGTRFQSWAMEDGMPASWVSGLAPVPGGAIWVSTGEGLVRFLDGRFDRAQVDGKDLAGGIGAMDLDAQGRLWFFRRDGIYHQNGALGFERIPGRRPGRSTALACSPATGSLFVIMGEELWERNRDGVWRSWATGAGLPGKDLWGLREDGQGRLWVASARQLLCKDPGETAFHDVSGLLPGLPFSDGVLLRSQDGSVCIPTNNGVLRVLGNSHQVLDGSAGLPCRWVRAGLLDAEGNFWILGKMLYRLLGRGQLQAYTSAEGLPGELIWCLYRDPKGGLWAGTNNGLARFGPQGWARVPGTEGMAVAAIAMDRRDRLWVGPSTGTLRCLEPGRTAISEQPFRALHFQSRTGGGRFPQEAPDSGTALLLDHAGSLWIGANGVFRVDFARSEIIPEFGPPELGQISLSVNHLEEDRQGRIWAATSLGLATRDGQGWHRWGRTDGLRQDDIQGLAPAGDGSYWVWYNEPSGMDRVTWEQGRFKVLTHLDRTSGLASNSVFSAVLDHAGALWVGTDRGLDRLHGGAHLHLGRGNGLVGEDCASNSCLVDGDGDLWQGTSTGLARIHTSRGQAAVAPPHVHILKVSIGRIGHEPPFALPRPIRHRDAALEFHFAAPTFVDESAVQYQVRLIGLEDEWRDTEVFQARYAGLAGGRYRFEVRARYGAGEFGPAEGFPFEILPPWWRAGWFTSLMFLAGAAAIYLAVHLRLGSLARHKARLEALVADRTLDLQKANEALFQANDSLKSLSLTDPLTGLRNRRYLTMIIGDEVAAVQRNYHGVGWQFLPNADLIFFMIDLDHFKKVNDRFGHTIGDQVLQATSAELQRGARAVDAIIRWGGEEFLLVARATSRSEAPAMAERMRAAMADQSLVLESGEVVKWTCSIGFASLPFNPADPQWLGWERTVALADACLYVAKESGRNAWAGVLAREGLQRFYHDSLMPWQLQSLAEEGLLDLVAGPPAESKPHV